MIFNWFVKNRPATIGSFLPGMTDVHTHLLPAVDDGAASRADAIAILRDLQEAGITRAFCTPHVMADLPRNGHSFLQEQFAAFLPGYSTETLGIPCPGDTLLPSKSISLNLAAEYMLDHAFFSRLEEGLLTYNGNHVLLETSYLSAPSCLENLLYEVSLRGYRPIVAHPERYLYIEPERYLALKNSGCLFQLNLFSLCGYYGKNVQQRSEWLLKKGYYEFVGTDTHKPGQYTHVLHHKISVANCLLEKLIRQNDMLWK